MNRKILLAGIFILMMAAFTACGNGGGVSVSSTPPIPPSESGSVSASEPPAGKGESSSFNEGTSQSSQETASVPLDSEGSSEEAETGDTGSASSILIAYFSWSGNTKQLAEMIQEQTGGELFEIMPETPYTDDINQLSGISLQEQRDNVRPPLSGDVDDMSSFDVVFIGYPSWWSDMPMPVFTFLESYDFSGKTVVPFTTYGNSVWGRSLQSIRGILPETAILDGFAVQEHELQGVSQKVEEWLQGLEL